jgi:hypothetical protein
MPKFNIEFKIKHTTDAGVETRHVKTVRENPVDIAQLVQEAASEGGGLEFLTVRQIKAKPQTTVKAVNK